MRRAVVPRQYTRRSRRTRARRSCARTGTARPARVTGATVDRGPIVEAAARAARPRRKPAASGADAPTVSAQSSEPRHAKSAAASCNSRRAGTWSVQVGAFGSASRRRSSSTELDGDGFRRLRPTGPAQGKHCIACASALSRAEAAADALPASQVARSAGHARRKRLNGAMLDPRQHRGRPDPRQRHSGKMRRLKSTGSARQPYDSSGLHTGRSGRDIRGFRCHPRISSANRSRCWRGWSACGSPGGTQPLLEPHLGGALADTALQTWVARGILLLARRGHRLDPRESAQLSRAAFRPHLGLDRLLGAVFGVVRGAVIAGFVVMLGQAANSSREPWWKRLAC